MRHNVCRLIKLSAYKKSTVIRWFISGGRLNPVVKIHFVQLSGLTGYIQHIYSNSQMSALGCLNQSGNHYLKYLCNFCTTSDWALTATRKMENQNRKSQVSYANKITRKQKGLVFPYYLKEGKFNTNISSDETSYLCDLPKVWFHCNSWIKKKISYNKVVLQELISTIANTFTKRSDLFLFLLFLFVALKLYLLYRGLFYVSCYYACIPRGKVEMRENHLNTDKWTC